jgi:hypothetical protein
MSSLAADNLAAANWTNVAYHSEKAGIRSKNIRLTAYFARHIE